jgi:tetratricopeptide (TPR) repeat protein
MLGTALASAGDLAGARRSLERSLQIAPEAVITPYLLTVVLVAANAPHDALKVARAGRPWVRDFGTAVALHSLGQSAESRTILARAEARKARADGELNAKTDPYQIAEGYAWIGDNDRAFALLEAAIRNHDPGIDYLKHSPLMGSLRGDARWKPLLRKLNLPE